jgi:hypothetical protein
MKTRAKPIRTQINQLEDDLIELSLADNSSNVSAYFTKEEWGSLKTTVNEFEYDKKGSESKSDGLNVYIYQNGVEVMLNLVDNYNSSLTSFSEGEWKRFKKAVNDFKFEH